MLKRLMNQRSQFDWDKMDKSIQKHEELVNSMCQFPRILPSYQSSINQTKRAISVSPLKKHMKVINAFYLFLLISFLPEETDLLPVKERCFHVCHLTKR